ncbi:hypothetical protein FA13DRAFT_1634918 [Coprinellus micaceus]|uniref:YMC020W-like alpha/beta hydrolase domain-containing protein n=1 Tax=Coprinellus micaceus TaxID=71717 RepID=A0A4Y7SZ54_COPMI|nr:hypothetical protein FA13DRAFT_1634918 [Coprinellus micaceus]
MDSGETEREKARVALEATSTTSTTTSPSAPVTEANVNANGNESPPSNGKSFVAGTSEDVAEGWPVTGVQGNGRGKKGDGEVNPVGAPEDVGQGATRGEGNKLNGASSLALGSDAERATGAGVASGEGLEEARPGSNWLSPWAWIGTSTSIATATTPSENEEAKGQKADVAENLARSSPEAKIDEAPEPTVVTPERELELPNPIEESLKANRAGWTSFFTKQSLFVKAIGYGETTSKPVKAIKRDEHGVEIMDLDSDDESEFEHGSKKDDHSSNGEERPSKGSSSGSSTPAPPSPSGSVPVPNSKQPQPPVAEKSKSAPVTPKRTASPSPSVTKKNSTSSSPPNLVLPTWADTFHTPPRSIVLRPPSPPVSPPTTPGSAQDTGVGTRLLGKTMKFVSNVLWAKDGAQHTGGYEQHQAGSSARYGQELPKSWEVLDGDVRGISKDALRGCRRVVIIGVHGWFPGALMRTMFGEPTGTSSKFANMMEQAVQEFENEQGVQLEKITKIPLEGEGTIERRVEKLYSSLVANAEWIDDLREADVIFVATHSQGSVVSTHLMSKLVQEGVIYPRPEELIPTGGDTFPSAVGLPRLSERKIQRVCCLALCGIHLGPLRYLRSSSVVAPYIQYFENAAARELFEFQNTESAVSKAYVKALENVLCHGIKMVYVASLNDQVVPIYSGIFTAATHPLILRALYIDGDAYHSSDFLSNLLVLLLRLRNSGIPDGGLLAHLSEATAGSLSGVGHSTAYEELATYSLAVRYLFMTNNGSEKHTSLVIEPFDAAHEQNDYEIPWSLRDVIADERVIHFFSSEVSKLRDAFRDWHPKTTILRDLKRKLQPIQRLPPSFSSGSYSTSKL